VRARSLERVMAKDLVTEVEEVVEHTMEEARPALDNYFDVFQKAMGINPWSGTEWVDKAQRFAVKNVHAAFEFVDKLSKAKDVNDAMKIQSEFVQTQLNSFSEQLKTLGQSYTKAASDAAKMATSNFSH
jgi:Phasin protein